MHGQDERRRAARERHPCGESEFARGGYYGTSTEAIARRVGVSQPYLFRLFPGKKAMFLAAAAALRGGHIRTFEDAAKGLEGEEKPGCDGGRVQQVIAEQPERLLMQMQMYVAVAAAEAAGDHEFGEAVRAGWMRLWDTVHLRARR